MAVGIALSAIYASRGFLATINLTLRPLSLAISLPKNSASLLAPVIAELF